MTCIVALVDNGKVYMGGDSAGVGDYSITLQRDEKVFVNNGYLFGCCGSIREKQILQHCFEPPRLHPDDDVHMHMVKYFIPALRRELEAQHVNSIAKNENLESVFLVGIAGKLFQIHVDLQVLAPSDNYMAAGCGEDLALGAMHTLVDNAELSPEDKILKALTASAYFSAGVRAPFHVISL